jgi:hypothetical protein
MLARLSAEQPVQWQRSEPHARRKLCVSRKGGEGNPRANQLAGGTEGTLSDFALGVDFSLAGGALLNR